MTTRLLLWFIFVSLLLAPVPGSAAAPPVVREDLVYRVSLGPWSDVARVHLRLKELTPGHYLAEFTGAAQGMWRLLNRWLPERFSTEMVYREGRLLPLVYREEFVNRGHHVVREYRFDYERHRLTLWRKTDDRPKVKKWTVPMKGPLYDLLSLLYNVRLGVLGPLRGGDTLRVLVLSAKPHKMDFRIGPETAQGRKVMLDFRLPESDRVDSYFIYLNPDQVPTLAWTRVTLLGKLAGHLLNPGGIQKALLPEVASTASPGSGARPR